MEIYICNDCNNRSYCIYAFKSELPFWCKHPNAKIRNEQNKRFDQEHKNDYHLF